MTAEEFKEKFKVGDKVTQNQNHWKPHEWVEILFLGRRAFFHRDKNGIEGFDYYVHNWLPYTEPEKPKKMKKVALGIYRNTWGEYLITPSLKTKEEFKEWCKKVTVEFVAWPCGTVIEVPEEE